MDGRLADCAFVDPQLNVQFDGFTFDDACHPQKFVSASSALSADTNFAFLKHSLETLRGCCSPTALIYFCVDWHNIMEMTVAAHACGLPLCAFSASGSIGASDRDTVYRNVHRLICVLRTSIEFSIQDAKSQGRNRRNVWTHPAVRRSNAERIMPVSLLSRMPSATPRSAVTWWSTRYGTVWLEFSWLPRRLRRICCGVEFKPTTSRCRHTPMAESHWSRRSPYPNRRNI